VRSILVAALLVTAAARARADHCEVVPGRTGRLAVALMPPGATILRMCGSCTRRPAAHTLEIADAGVYPVPVHAEDAPIDVEHAAVVQINVDGRAVLFGVDLAFVFVRAGDHWSNLAALIGCIAPADAPSLDGVAIDRVNAPWLARLTRRLARRSPHDDRAALLQTRGALLDQAERAADQSSR
jgi:hypothetical protein